MAIWSKKEGLVLTEVVTHVRLSNYIKKLGANFEQVEYCIKNIADSKNPQKLLDTAIQIAQLSTSIRLDKMSEMNGISIGNLQQPMGISNNQSMVATIRVVAVVMAMAVTFQ